MGGHSPILEFGLSWGLEAWNEPAPLLDHMPSQKMPKRTRATSVGCYGGSLVFLLLFFPCCPQIPVGDGGPCHGAGSFVAFRAFAFVAVGF